MKIKLNQPLLALDGETVMKDSAGEDMSLKDAIVGALMTDLPNNPNMPQEHVSGEDKNKNFLLANKIYNCEKETIDLKAEQIVEIKKQVGKVWGTSIVGRVFSMLDKAK